VDHSYQNGNLISDLAVGQTHLARSITMKVGFIGLGHMGAGMATNLLEGGHDVTVYNRSRAKAEALKDMRLAMGEEDGYIQIK
jgi:glutamyl-tRNA reductase